MGFKVSREAGAVGRNKREAQSRPATSEKSSREQEKVGCNGENRKKNFYEEQKTPVATSEETTRTRGGYSTKEKKGKNLNLGYVKGQLKKESDQRCTFVRERRHL